MLTRLLGEHIEAVWLLNPALHNVILDPGQMEQVILNLSVNARDAMPTGGKLTIETSNVRLDRAAAEARGLAAQGDYVLLTVSDTGFGMGRDVQVRVFEPFFTTKERGKGTGLGLSTVHGIVSQSGGSVLVYSEPDVGTTFKVYFPATMEGVEATPEKPAFVPNACDATILLVEDEEPVRRFAATALSRAGYNVLSAQNAGEALQIVQGFDGHLNLLLTDVVMPGMSGRELGELLVSFKPTLKVLFMSGYSGEAVVRHGVLARGTSLLEKPYSIAALLSKVGESLASAP
jgi:CheY-like chemotaxis protein